MLDKVAKQGMSWLPQLRRCAYRFGFTGSFASPRLTTNIVLALLGGLTVFHVIATLGYSLRRGRLSIVPYFDDVAYLLDALARLKEFDTNGLFGLLRTLVADPPHAPITAIVATLGFAITPNSRLGSYALSGLWLLPILALTARFLRGLPLTTRAGVICSMLALPMFSMILGSLRPDTLWGLLAGSTAVILATADLRTTKKLTVFLLGVLVGMVGLAKPTGMPAAMAVLGVAYVGAVVTALQEKRQQAFMEIARNSALVALGATLLLLPYLALHGKALWNYIRMVMIDQRDLWFTEGSAAFHLLYYIRAAQFMMGWLWPVGLVFILGNGICSIVSPRPENRAFLQYLSGVGVLLTSYAIPSISPAKSLYVGSLFYGTATMVMMWNLGDLLRRLPIPPIVVAIAGFLIFMTCWRPSTLLTAGSEAAVVDEATNALAPSLLKKLAERDPNQPVLKILVTSAGPVFDATFKYLAEIKRLPGEFRGGYFIRSWDELFRAASTADLVTVTDFGAIGQGGAGVGVPYPSTVFQNRLMREMKDNQSFAEIANYTDRTGHRTVAFFRRAAGVRITHLAGFRGWEGPYPRHSLPVVSWMTARQAEIEVSSQDAIDVQLGVHCQSSVSTRLEVEVAHGLTRVTNVEGPIGRSFTTVRVPISLSPNVPTLVTLNATALAEVGSTLPGPLLCGLFTVESAP